MSNWFMKEPCKHCPFRRDVRPFLRPERAEEISGLASNKYSEFHCHKTIDHDDDTGEGILTRSSLVCAGFLAMQIEEAGISAPEGFEPSQLVYADSWEMNEAYEMAENGYWEAP